MGIFNWFRGNNPAAEKAPRFFEFMQGAKRRQVDPLSTWLKLLEHPTLNLDHFLKDFQAGDHRAWVQGVAVAREVFGLPTASVENPGGATDQEAFATLVEFIVFALDQKKSIDTPQNLSRSAGLVFTGWTPPSDSGSISTPTASAPSAP